MSRRSVRHALIRSAVRSVVYAGIVASAAAPASAVDFRITDTAWGAIDNDWWGSFAFGRADDKGFFGRGVTTGTFNYRLPNGTTLGASSTAEYFSNLDINVDNIGDEPSIDIYTAIVYATGVWGDILYGKTFGAITELMDVAPSAIGFDYTVNSPFFIHTERPRFAPRSPTASLDFHQASERFGFYSADYDGFRLGMTYATKTHDSAASSLLNVQSKHAIDVALVWAGTLGNFRLRATGAYQQAEADQEPVNTSTAADQAHWAIGGTLWWHGWCIGGNYAYTENTLGLRNVNNESYQFGAMYTYGKWSVSASHGNSTDLYSRDLTANPFLGGLGDPTMNMTEIAASYWIDEHVKLSVAGIDVQYNDNLTFPPTITNTVSNDGRYGVMQIYVHF